MLCAYMRPRYQVSVYRLGPLVIFTAEVEGEVWRITKPV